MLIKLIAQLTIQASRQIAVTSPGHMIQITPGRRPPMLRERHHIRGVNTLSEANATTRMLTRLHHGTQVHAHIHTLMQAVR